MGLGNWFRRGDRQQPPAPYRDGAGAGADPGPVAAVTPEPEADRSHSVAGRPDGAGDGGWDGGWRRVAPPAVTVARSTIGVSDGLRFRDGLASWQNLAFAGELGHAVLPSAPVGLIHGVARPGGARSTAPGGPLLLRAARTGTDGETEPAAGPAAATAGNTTRSGRAGGRPAPATVQRYGATTSTPSSGNGAPGRHNRGDAATTRETTAGATRASGTPSAPEPDAARGPATSSASRQTAGTAPAPVPLQQARPAAVRPRRTAPPLIIARRPAMALRRIAGVLPPMASAPATPVTTVGTASTAAVPTDLAVDQPAATATAAAADKSAAAAVRPALGKPLRELPIGAVAVGATAPGGVVPSAPAGQEAAGMPVLQRQASSDAAAPAAITPSPEATKPSVRQSPPSGGRVPKAQAPQPSQPSQPDSSGPPARARGGIGAPLTSLPSTARLGSDAPLLGDRRRAQPESTGPRRNTASAGGPGTAPLQLSPSVSAEPASKALNAPAEMPVRSPGVPARPGASTPESAAVQRAADPTRPNTPLVAPSPSAPAAPVRVRRIAPEREKGRSTGPAAGPGGSTPAVQRSRALLAARALDVSTGSAEGFSGPTAAGGSTARPVVAATWRRDAPQSGHDASPSQGPAPSPGRGSTRTGEHRAQPDAAPGRSAPHAPTRPAGPTPPHRPRGTGPGPAPGGSSAGGPAPRGAVPGGTVQRLVSGSPSPGTIRSSGTPSGRTSAGDPGRVTRPGAGAGTDRSPGRGPAAARSLLRLVQRSPRGGVTTPPSSPGVLPPGQGPAESQPAPPPPAPRSPVPGTPPGAPTMTSAPSATRPVPVVRPHPPGTGRPGATAVPVQRMAFPVVPESAAPATTGPVPESVMSATTGPPPLAVRIPQRTPNPNPPPTPVASQPPAAGARASSATAEVLQRAAADAGITGVPVRAAPVQRAEPPGRTRPTGPAATAEPPAAHRVTGADIEELARRLIDPVSRLIRADLRRGRERTGRLHDGRR